MGRIGSCVRVVALTVLVPLGAAAQGGDSAAAAELFRQGREALLEKRYDFACAALAESDRLDSRVGTLINLAQCEEAIGKLVLAHKHLDKALRMAREAGDPREAFVNEQRQALAPRVAHLVVRVAPDAPPDTRVKLDGVELAPAALGAPIPVEGGARQIAATAAGRTENRFEVIAALGGTIEVRVGPGDARAAEAPAAAPAPAPPPPSRAGDTQRWIALGVGGAGAIALGLGAYWGVQALIARNDPRCQDGVCDSEAGAQAQRDGRDAGNRATIAFVAGGALAAGAVVLFVTAPRGVGLTVAPQPGGASLGARGVF